MDSQQEKHIGQSVKLSSFYMRNNIIEEVQIQRRKTNKVNLLVPVNKEKLTTLWA